MCYKVNLGPVYYNKKRYTGETTNLEKKNHGAATERKKAIAGALFQNVTLFTDNSNAPNLLNGMDKRSKIPERVTTLDRIA